MTSLLDIAPSTRTVAVGGAKIAVYGVSAKGIAYLIQRFPVLREVLVGRKPELSASMLFELVPDAIASIIAAGTGNPNDVNAEEIAARLPAESQVDLLEAIIELTMPKGVVPFVQRLMSIMGQVDSESLKAAVESSTKAPVMKSRKQSSA